MAGSATNYLRTKVLGHTLGFAPFVMPPQIFLGLCTSLPSAATGGTEVVGGGYARKQSIFAMDGGGRPDLAVLTTTIEWPPATTNWGSVGWFELWDAISGGNRIYHGELVDPANANIPMIRPVVVSDIVRIAAGTLRVQAI